MGCDKLGHRHCWPTSGTLIIQRCETRCNFCEGPAAKKTWKYAWFLRRHVRSVHVKDGKGKYPSLIVPMDWDEGKLRGSAKLRAAEMRIKQEHPEPVYYVDQPHYDEQLYSEQMFAPDFVPSMGDDPDFSLEGRLIDPSKLGGRGMSHEDNPNGYFPAFANESASASAKHWSVDNIDSFLLTNSATGLERAQALFQTQAREEARIREEMGDMTDDNMVHNTAYISSHNVKIEDETDAWDSKLAVDDANGLPNGLTNDFPCGLVDSIEQPAQTLPSSPTYIGKIENDPDDNSAGPRFFMGDYSPEAEDADDQASEDDHADVDADAGAKDDDDDSSSVSAEEDFETRPLAEVFDQYRVKLSFSEHTRMLGLLHGVAEFMEGTGLGLGSMMPCVEAFARELASKLARKDKELYETAIRANMGWS